jgi:hypothetical protein
MDVLNKLLPPVSSGDYRILPPRHELQIAIMIAFIVSSLFQIFGGPAERSALAEVPLSTIALLGSIAITGSLLCLGAAVVSGKHPWEAMGMSLAGFTLLSPALCFQIWLIMDVVEGWQSSGLFWINVCLAVGFVFRWFHLVRDAIRIWRHK